MSDNEPTNENPPEKQEEVEKKVEEEEKKEEESNEEPRDFFLPGLLLVVVTVLAIICYFTGRWASTDKVPKGQWVEIGPWGVCTCNAIIDLPTCAKFGDIVYAAKTIAIVSCIIEFVALCILMKFPTGEALKLPLAGMYFLLFACLVISVGAYAALYDKSWCDGTLHLADTQDLWFAFGLRVVECVIALVMGILCLMPRKHNIIVFIAAILLFFTVFTTTIRGWTMGKNDTQNASGQMVSLETGLWDICSCVHVREIACDDLKRLVQAADAFALISAFFLAVTFIAVTQALPLPLAVGKGCVWAAVVCMVLTYIFFSAAWSEEYCGAKLKDIKTAKLRWGFGIIVPNSALLIIAGIFVVMMKK